MEAAVYVKHRTGAQHLNMCEKTMERCAEDEEMKALGFPQPVKIRGKRWFRLTDLIEFKRRFPEMCGAQAQEHVAA
jgi:hypothetical protein